MRALVLALLCGLANATPAPTDAEAQQAHARGQCGTLGPGTGLGADGRGWVVSMLPGPHEFRVVGGSVGVTVLQQSTVDLDAGRPTFIAANGPGVAESCGPTARKGSTCLIQWRGPGFEWGPISRLFLYPPQVRTSTP